MLDQTMKFIKNHFKKFFLNLIKYFKRLVIDC